MKFLPTLQNNLTLLELFLILLPFSNQTYLVGGCVRDLILGKSPKDFDLVTDINLDIITQELLQNGWKIDEAGKQFFNFFVNNLYFLIFLIVKILSLALTLTF